MKIRLITLSHLHFREREITRHGTGRRAVLYYSIWAFYATTSNMVCMRLDSEEIIKGKLDII